MATSQNRRERLYTVSREHADPSLFLMASFHKHSRNPKIVLRE